MQFLFSIRANFTVALSLLGVVETTTPDKQNRLWYSSICDHIEWPACVVTLPAMLLQHLVGLVMASEELSEQI
jgi:hypothetical protein